MGSGESKIKFAGKVKQFREKPLNSAEIDLASITSLNLGVVDIYTLLTLDELRAILGSQPSNLALLLVELIRGLDKVKKLLALRFREDDSNVALAHLRLISRVFPILLEAGWVHALLWDGAMPFSDQKLPLPADDARPLGVVLIDSLMELLFMPSFTVLAAVLNMQGPLRAVWHSGLGVKSALSWTTAIDQRRVEVLKTLLAVVAAPLFTTPDSLHDADRRLAAYATSSACANSEVLFYSLVNVILSYDPIGWGVPYASFVVDMSREQLVESAVQTLCVLLDHRSAPRPAAVAAAVGAGSADSDAAADPAAAENTYLARLQALAGEPVLAELGAGLSRLLSSIIHAQNTYLPSARRTISAFQELLVLLWKLLEANPGFRSYVCGTIHGMNMVASILVMMYQGRQELSHTGVLHHGASILLLLSGDRRLSVTLNNPLTVKLPLDLVLANCTHADLLFMVVHKLVVGAPERPDSLNDVLLSVLFNVSPYTKSLEMVTAVKIVGLVELVSQPRFLLANDRNVRMLFDLVDILNNLIQYQFEGSSHLVYAIIRKRHIFEGILKLQPESVAPVPIPQLPEYAGKAASEVAAAIAPPPVPAPEALPAGATAAAPVAAPAAASAPAAPPAAAPAKQEGTAGDAAATEASVVRAAVSAADRDATAEAQAAVNDEQAKPADAAAAPAPAAVTAAETPSVVPRPAGAEATTPAVSAQVQHVAAAPTSYVQQFVPTTEWIHSWKSRLPLQPIMRMIDALSRPVQDMCNGGYVDDGAILRYIRATTLVGLLPVPHRIVIRMFRSNDVTDRQVTALMWALVFVRNVLPPLFFGLHVRLFFVGR